MISRAIDIHIRGMVINNNIVDLYNNQYNTNLSTTELAITKVITHQNLKSTTVYYTITNECKVCQLFFLKHKALFIRQLKRKIRIFRFPNVTFKDDKAYSLIVNKYIMNLLNT